MTDRTEVSGTLEDAIRFATRAHAGKTRNGTTTPFVIHPQHVLEILQSVGVEDPDILRAAVLHDTVEDASVSADRLAQEFGGRVATLVSELTRTDDTRTDREALRRYVLTLSPAARLIKVADRIDNVRDLRHILANQRRVGRYLEETHDAFVSGLDGADPPIPVLLSILENEVLEIKLLMDKW